MANYSQENIKKLNNDYKKIGGEYIINRLKWFSINSKLTQEEAKEYLLHGFFRRLKILKRCIDNIFKIYPPEKTDLLTDDENHNIIINWQAFNINLFGSIDNLAWLLIKEKQLSMRRETDAKFNNPQILKILSPPFINYLKERKVWFETIKEFRDALAHRISPYMPMGIDPKTEKSHNLPLIKHSFSENSPELFLHAQLIADWETLMEFGNKFFDELNQILILDPESSSG